MATTSRKRHRRPLEIQSASNRYKSYDAHLVRWLIQKATAHCTPIVGSPDPKYNILLKEYLAVSKELAKRGVQPPLDLKPLLNAIIKLRTRCYQWYKKTMPKLSHSNNGHLAFIQNMRQVRKVLFNIPLGYDTSDTDQNEPVMDSLPGATYQHSPAGHIVDSDQDSDTEESNEPDEDEISKPLSQYTYSIAVSNQFTHTERVQASAASNRFTYTDEDESIAASDQDIEEEELESSVVSYRVTYSDDEEMNPGPFAATASNQDPDTDEDEDDCITASHQYSFTNKDESIVAYANGRSDWHNYTDESLAASDEDKNADPDSEIEQEEYSSASDVADTNQDEPAMDSFPGATYQNSPDDQDETMVDSDQDSDTEEESSEPDEDEISKPLSRNTYYIAVSNRFTHTERVQASAASNQYTYTDEDESVAASDQDIEEEELESSAVSYRVTYSDDEKMNPGPFIATTSNQDPDTDEDEDDCITASHQYPAYYYPFTVKDESIAASNQYAHGRSDRHNYTDDESENTSDPDSEIEQEECSSASEDVDDEDFSDETEEP